MTVSPARLLAICGRVVLSDEVERAVRMWRFAQPRIPTRAEAVYQLMLEGLDEEGRIELGWDAAGPA